LLVIVKISIKEKRTMILTEQHILEFRIELEELITKREGWVVTNQEDEFHRRLPSFNQYDFENLEQQMRELRQRLISLGEK